MSGPGTASEGDAGTLERPGTHDTYEAIGVRRVINANAALTRLGGSLMPPPVLDAMRAAAGASSSSSASATASRSCRQRPDAPRPQAFRRKLDI
jgi:hypothetical protein